MPLTLPPDAPSTADLENFDVEADAWVAWWTLAAGEINTLEANIEALASQVTADANEIAAAILVAQDAAGFVATSISPLTVGAGTKTIHFDEAKPNFNVNDEVWIVQRTDASIKMRGTIATMDVGNDDITVTVTSGGVFGTGSYSSWLIMSGAFIGSGATAADMWAGTTDAAAVSPQSLKLAAQFQALTDAATIDWNAATQGFNVKVTLGGNRTMAAPTNLLDGFTYSLYLTQDGTGSRTVSWNAIFDWGVVGAPTLSTGAGKVDQVFGQYSAATGKLHVNFRKAA